MTIIGLTQDSEIRGEQEFVFKNGVWTYFKTDYPMIKSSGNTLIDYVKLLKNEDIIYVKKIGQDIYEASYRALSPERFKLEDETGINGFLHILTTDKTKIFRGYGNILRKELKAISYLELELKRELGDYRK